MESPKKIRAIEDSAPLEDGVAPAIEDGAPLEDAKDDKEDDKEPVDKLGAFSNFATLRPENIQVALDRVIEVYGNPKTPKKKDQLHNRDTRAFSFCGTRYKAVAPSHHHPEHTQQGHRMPESPLASPELGTF